MKFVYIFFVVCCFLFKFNNADVLGVVELSSAQSIINQIFNVANYEDPCNYTPKLFQCLPKNDGTGQAYVYKFAYATDLETTITSEFSDFKSIESIIIGGVVQATNVYKNINQLTKLTYLNIGLQNTTFPNSLVLPQSRLHLSFNEISVGIPSTVFTTGLVYRITIDKIHNGFSLPSLLSKNTAFEKLTMPMNSVFNSFPAGFDTSLTGLIDMSLSIENDRNADNYVDYNLNLTATFSNLNLVYISFYYDDETNLQYWDIPFSTQLKLGVSKKFKVLGQGFKLPSNGQVNFSNFTQGTAFEFQNVGFLDQCTSISCISFPANSSISIKIANVNLGYIDFSNIISAKVEANQLEQLLPTLINYENIRLLTLINSNFNGTIPLDYCKLPKSVYSFGGNKLSGKVPSCFECVGGNFDGTNQIFGNGNSYTDFTITSPPSSCPTYSITVPPVDLTSISSNKPTIVTINGKDFGWSFNLTSPPSNASPKLTITIPNNQMILYIPNGYGFNKTFTVNFGGNYQFSHSFNYSYELSKPPPPTSPSSDETPSNSTKLLTSSILFLCLIFLLL